MEIKIKKIESAGRSWGSPGNNYRTSGKYAIIIDGVLRGKMWAAGVQRYMDRPAWEILTVNPDDTGIRSLRTIMSGGRKAAIAWIQANVEKFQ